MKMYLIAAAVLLFISGCAPKDKRKTNIKEIENSAEMKMHQPRVIIYKTRGDYRDLVKVKYDKIKERISSYPSPSDIVVSNDTAGHVLPLGYLLDTSGISLATVFIKISIADYAAMDAAPEISYMKNIIVDFDPFTEFYDCGWKDTVVNAESYAQRLIENGNLGRTCRRLK